MMSSLICYVDHINEFYLAHVGSVIALICHYSWTEVMFEMKYIAGAIFAHYVFVCNCAINCIAVVCVKQLLLSLVRPK